MEESEKDIFMKHYKAYYKQKPNKRPYNTEELNEIAKQIYTAKTSSNNKTRRDYYLLNTYDVVTVNENKYVIKKVQNQGDPLIYLVPEEDIYDRLKDIHINCGHGSRDKMVSVIHENCSISRPCIEMFLQSCKTCQTKKNKSTSKVVAKPSHSKYFMTRGQVDVIDLQSIPDGEFKWLLNYQDPATKYLCLRPLKSKRAIEVAQELLKIFLQFGAPSVLQSDNGREFASLVIKELKTMWPDLFIVHGRPWHPQSQGSVERSNQDVENMLRAWMLDNKSTAWSTGCHFVQWQKNSTLHRVTGQSPFKAVFGSEPKHGLKSTNLAQNVINGITTEEELKKLVTETDSAVQESSTLQYGEQVVAIDEGEERFDDLDENGNSNDMLIQPLNESNLLPIRTENGTDEAQVALELNDDGNGGDTDIPCPVCKGNIKDNADKCTTSTKDHNCSVGQKRRAEQMISVTKKKLPNLKIGDCVFVNVNKVDCTPGDPPNLIAVITDIKNGVYQVGTPSGIINSWLSRSDLKKASSNFITLKQVNSSKFMSITEAVYIDSLFKEQGYVKCLCQPSKIQCKSNRCHCFKAKVQCSSKCHKSGPCINK